MKRNLRAEKILKIVKDFSLQQTNSPYLEWYSTDDYEKVTLAIIHAFLDTQLGEGIGFFEATCLDSRKDRKSPTYQSCRNKDERIFWENILLLGNSEQRINYFYPNSAHYFMDEKGLIFALPCYILWEIEGNGKISVNCFEDFAKLPLNSKQKQAFLMTVEFLQNRAFEHNNESDYDDWEKVKQKFIILQNIR